MHIKEVVATLERFAPLPLQDSYDNAGLQVGLTGSEELSGVMLCLDVRENVLEEAAHLGCNLIVSHHPLLFRPLKQLTERTEVERCVRSAVLKNIALYAAHTNLDNAHGGVNFMMAEKLKLQNVRFLRPMLGQNAGSGAIGELPEKLSPEAFTNLVKEVFHAPGLSHNVTTKQAIQTVALCGGAGSFLLDDAIEAGADAFLTGEMNYHQYFGHEKELQILVAGHYETEQFTVELLRRILTKAHPGLRIFETTCETNPVKK